MFILKGRDELRLGCPHAHDFLQDLEPVFKLTFYTIICGLCYVIECVGKVLVQLVPYIRKRLLSLVATFVVDFDFAALEEQVENLRAWQHNGLVR